MKKIRDGKSGELTAEIFETWFPDEPELMLIDFIKTNQPTMFVVIRPNDADVILSQITQEYAQVLLNEFRILRAKI